MDSLKWIKDIPRKYKDREFLVDTISRETLTYAQMHTAGLCIASDLRRKGIRQGERVALLLNNSAEFAKLYFGCLYAGIVTVPINPVFMEREIDFIVKHSGAKLLIVSLDTISRIDLEGLIKKDIQILILKEKGKDFKKQLSKHKSIKIWNPSSLKKGNTFKALDQISSDDIMTIVYTSGTSSQPVGVMHRIRDLFGNALLFNQQLGIGPDNRFYGILAMSYLGGYYNLLMIPWTAGSSIVLTDSFNPRLAFNFWKLAKKYKVNTLWLVPSIMSILLEIDRGNDGLSYCPSNIRLALVGTAPLSVKLRSAFENRYKIRVYENYGLSETLFISTNTPSVPVIDGCVGRILPGVQVEIRRNNTEIAPCGEEGEIYVRTPYLMKGYYDSKLRKARTLSQKEWFPTGDIGIVLEAGELFITGRKKDLIIKGGVNISPAVIEDTILQNDAVAEVAAVGVPHPLYGEDIVIAVRLKKDRDFKKIKSELVQVCRKRLGIIRQPAHILEFEKLPKSSSGKIQKYKVRELLVQKFKLDGSKKEYQLSVGNNPQKNTIVPGRVKRNINRPSQKTIRLLAKYPPSIISDCMNRMGIMDGIIQSLVRGRPFCGPALTVEEVEGGNLMSHAALELVHPGDVIVIDAKGTRTRACWGGLQTLMAKEKKVAAIVVNGAVRDYHDIVQSGIPVYAIGTSPGGPLKKWGGNINYPIACANVVVNPGDILAGDDDGVVVVPQDLIDRVLALVEKWKAKEEIWSREVKKGISTIDAIGLRDKFKQFGIEID